MLHHANVHNARVDEDFGFQDRVYNLGMTTLKADVIKPVLATWKVALDAFDAALKQSQKSLQTGIVEEADRKVDRLYSALRKYMDAFSVHPTAEVAAEAVKVSAIFDKYGYITGLGYDQEYGALKNAMQDLTALSADVQTLLALQPWLDAIALAEAEFQNARASQTMDQGQFQAGLVKETRLAADAAYKKFEDTINAFVIAFGEEDYKNFIQNANVMIDNLNANIKSRITRAKNAKEKEEKNKGEKTEGKTTEGATTE